MAIRKVKIGLPIKVGHVVLSGPDVVSDVISNGRIHFRMLFFVHPLQTEKAIDGIGVHRGDKLPFRIAPRILFRTGDIDRPGGHQCDEHMLIDRASLFIFVVLVKIVAEPMGEQPIYYGDSLSRFAARQGGPATTTLIGYDQREALILGARPERRLAQSGMAHDRDSVLVDLGIAFEIVQGAAQPPRPGADGAPFVLSRSELAWSVEEGVNPGQLQDPTA